MAKPLPLRSENPQPQDVQFKHFGVMSSGEQSKASLFTSITVNVLLALIIVIIGAAAKKTITDNREKMAVYPVTPIKEKPPEPKPKPPLPKPPPPPPVKPPPPVPKLEIPKIKPPEPVPVKVDVPKPPTPVVTPAPPKIQVAAAAPKPVTVNLGHAAQLPNHDKVPAPVSLGSLSNPIAPSPNRTAVPVAIDLGHRGMSGMPPGQGSGPPGAKAVNMGSGQPNGSMSGGAPRAVAGVKLGVPGGTPGATGNGLGTSPPRQVQMGVAQQPPAAQVVTTRAPMKTPPTVLFKPRPVYTAEATELKLQGTVSVRIRVLANGSVQVIGVTSGLGHGLDQSALQVCQGMRFKPAMDASGNPTDWEGVVQVSFQMA